MKNEMYRLNKHRELYLLCSTIQHNDMPKNKGKGGKSHRRGAKGGDESKRELVFKEDMQDYCVVTAMLGDSRIELRDTSEKKRIGHICGKMRRKKWIAVGDLVLVSFREYQDAKCDVIYKYEADEVRNLKAYGEIADDSKDKSKEDVIFGEEGSGNVEECDQEIDESSGNESSEEN